MTAINHERPILKIIDDFKKDRSGREDKGPHISIKKKHRTQSEKEAIHRDAVKCLQHLLKHRNINVVTKFLSQEKSTKYQELLRDWFSRYGPVKFTQDGEILFTRRAVAPFSAAQEEPFWKLGTQRQRQPFDFVEELSKLIEKADRRRVRQTPDDRIDLEALDRAREILKGR